MDKLTVVIPVMRWDLVIDLLRDICSNTILPSKILVINNAIKPNNIPRFNVPIEILDFGKNIGVNAAWNYAFTNSEKNSHVSILNDDIRIKQHFFENVISVISFSKNIGVVCPRTVHYQSEFRSSSEKLYSYPDAGVIPTVMSKREGWAFTIRNSLLEQLPLIPDELFIFCGDDWIWTWAHELKFIWAKDISNVIYHQIGGSLRRKENKHLRALLKKEKREYSQLIKAAINAKRNKSSVSVRK